MAKANFAACLAQCSRVRGWLCRSSERSGGATNHGITIATLGDWRGRKVSKAYVTALTRTEAGEIYRALY